MMGSKAKADGRVMLLIWWSLPGLLDKWNQMMVTASRLLGTSRFNSNYIRQQVQETRINLSPMLLSNNPRDYQGPFRLPPRSLLDQFKSLRRNGHSLSGFTGAFGAWQFRTSWPSIKEVCSICMAHAHLQIIRQIDGDKLLTSQRVINFFLKSPLRMTIVALRS